MKRKEQQSRAKRIKPEQKEDKAKKEELERLNSIKKRARKEEEGG